MRMVLGTGLGLEFAAVCHMEIWALSAVGLIYSHSHILLAA